MERAVVAGVENHEAGLWCELVNLLQHKVVDILLRLWCWVVKLLEELVGQAVLLLEILLRTWHIAILLALLTAEIVVNLLAQSLGTTLKALDRLLAIQMLLVGRAVLVENHHIHLAALNLVDDLLLGITHTEVELCEGGDVVARYDLWEHLLDSHALIHPRHQAVRVIGRTRIGHKVVEALITTTLCHYLTQITANLLILVATHLLGVDDTTRVERWVESLGRALGEFVVVTQ